MTEIKENGIVEGIPSKWLDMTPISPTVQDDICPRHGEIKTLKLYTSSGYNVTEICLECVREIIQELDIGERKE